MKYQQFDPPEDLQPVVACFWTLEDEAGEPPGIQTIVPDGCMELIVHLGDLYRQYLDETTCIIQPRSFVFGQLTKPLRIEPTGRTHIFAVRFLPDGFLPFSSLPLLELENRAVPLDELFGPEGTHLDNQIRSAQSNVERQSLAVSFLRSRLSGSQSVDRLVKATIELMMAASGQLPISDLSEQSRINRRQLERRFATTIGLSPKQLSRLIRFHATLKLLLNNQAGPLTALAHEHNYYDQAHFIRDFKAFTGTTPGDFFKDHLVLSALFYGHQ
ncbi:MAG: AraC family transcriptional regulator [Bacteroidetes bacterium]|nr:AraC family transcriptional regulator [Bacteroidota bacterium]